MPRRPRKPNANTTASSAIQRRAGKRMRAEAESTFMATRVPCGSRRDTRGMLPPSRVGSASGSTLPPLRMMPTRRPRTRSGRASTAASAIAEDGSTRSRGSRHSSRSAARVAASSSATTSRAGARSISSARRGRRANRRRPSPARARWPGVRRRAASAGCRRHRPARPATRASRRARGQRQRAAGGEAAAADRDDQQVGFAAFGEQNQRRGALAGDHVGIGIGMYQGRAGVALHRRAAASRAGCRARSGAGSRRGGGSLRAWPDSRLRAPPRGRGCRATSPPAPAPRHGCRRMGGHAAPARSASSACTALQAPRNFECAAALLVLALEQQARRRPAHPGAASARPGSPARAPRCAPRRRGRPRNRAGRVPVSWAWRGSRRGRCEGSFSLVRVKDGFNARAGSCGHRSTAGQGHAMKLCNVPARARRAGPVRLRHRLWLQR